MLIHMYKYYLVSLLFFGLIITMVVYAQEPELVPGKWEFILNNAMSQDLEKIADLIEQERAEQDSIILEDEYSGNDHLANHTRSLLDTLEEAQKPHYWHISKEQAKQGVIAIFGEPDAITQESDLSDTACVHSIEWKNQYEGIVSADCEDGAVIQGIVKVPDSKQIQYEATVTPTDGKPYPVGWNAKWISNAEK